MTTIYKGYFIDEEKENFTNKTIYTVWDKKGILWLGTFYTIEEAKKYIDNK